jgi:AcrR family transcriptional regulator
VEAEERRVLGRAVIEVIASAGYPDTTIDAICRHAGLDRAAFDRHFDGLEDAYWQCFEEVGREYLGRVAAAFAAEDSWRLQMRSLAHAFVIWMIEDQARSRYASIESLRAGERSRRVREMIIQALFEFIDQGRQELDDPSSLTRETAEAVGLSIEAQIQSLVERGAFEEMNREVPRMMYETVLPYVGEEIASEELRVPPPLAADDPLLRPR